MYMNNVKASGFFFFFFLCQNFGEISWSYTTETKKFQSFLNFFVKKWQNLASKNKHW
jgi:hypothetical protein